MREYLQAVKSLMMVEGKVEGKRKHLNDAVGDNAFATQIAYGVVRHYFSLSASLNQLLSKPLPGKHADLRLLLLAGLYSVQHLKRPAHASVNAAVDAAASLNKPWAKGLVNGILREFLRNPPSITGIEAELDHPAWLIEEIQSAWPNRPEIFANNNLHAPLTLRVNLGKISRDNYLDRLKSEGIDAWAGRLADTAVTLAEPLPAWDIPGFAEGLASVQDEAPQLAAGLLDVKPGMRVLDACAAPGGKTCHLLEAEPQIKLTALDPDAGRMQKLEENLRRLELNCNRKIASLLDVSPDARGAEPNAKQSTGLVGFDRILLDSPCSATGIIRRHPDIKLMRSRADVDKLCKLQCELLDRAFTLLAPGGELLYSTCSILPQENDQVVLSLFQKKEVAKKGCIEGHSEKNASKNMEREAEILPIPLPSATASAVQTQAGLQLFPDAQSHDGFYYSRIRKTPRTEKNIGKSAT